MKEFKGTKGKWKILPTSEYPKWVDVTSKKGVISRTFYGDIKTVVYKEEAEANAKLIAAASDLLKALQNIENDDKSIPKKIWDMRNKAIKKALN